MDQRPTYEELETHVNALQIENDEIRKAKQAIEESEALHRTALESIHETVVITDDNGNINYACPNASRIFGLSQNQVYAKGTIQELINGYACDLSKLRKEKEISNIEWSVMDSSGRERFVRITVKSVFIKRGTVLYVIRDITDRKQMEQSRLADLKFFENIDKINRAFQGTTDFEKMLSDVLDVVLTIFDCDRASLVFPCDPDTTSWSASMERTKPEWPGALTLGLEVPMDPGVARIFRASRAADGPVEFGSGYKAQLPPKIAEQFNIQSQMTMALYPKTGQPWNFVLHQCSYPRVWTQEEKKLLTEIGRRMEDALTTLLLYRNMRDSKERLRKIIENTGAGYFLIGLDGNYQTVNASWLKMHGYNSSDEIIGRHFSATQVETDLHKAQTMVERLLSGKTITADEFSRQRKDGSVGYHSFSAHPVVKEGEIVGLEGFLIDITKRKRTERALSKSRAKFEAIFNSISEAIVFTDTHRRIVMVNPAFLKTFGFELEEVKGRCTEFLYENREDYEKQCQLRFRVDIETDHKPFLLRYRRKDGTLFWSESHGVQVKDDNGNIIGFLAIHQDVTKRLKEEQNRDLMLSRYKRKAAEMEAMFNGTKLLLEEENFKTVSREIFDICRGLTGARSGYVALLSDSGAENKVLFLEFGGLSCDVNPELPMPSRGLRGEVYKFGEAVYDNDFSKSKWMEYMPEGHVKLENVLFAPLKGNNETDGLIGLANKKGGFNEDDARIVSALGELAAISLKQSVTRGALQKSEMRLSQVEKLEAIGNLAGGIAHDFNNILSSIIGFTELALDEAPKGTALEDSLQEVYSAGKRAKDLVKQILAFARQSDEKITPIRPSMLVEEAIKFIRSTIPTSIDIKKDMQSDSLIMGNAIQIHQVFMNLFTNAAHAMEESDGVLEIAMKDVVLDKADLSFGMKPGDYIEIKVSDTGVGISPEIINSIFEPYFTTKGPGQGTGMGLAMVHGIVESYGGTIRVDSKLGKGTTFIMYLPSTQKQIRKQDYVPEELPTGAEKILFVDDELPIVKMGQQALERLGYEVTTRTSSIEALELFQAKPNEFDLVVTDMTMPNLTGDKLAIELMKIRSDIPVILCTGYSKRISDDTAGEIGIKAFAYKPVVKADLAKTVRKVLDDARSSAQA